MKIKIDNTITTHDNAILVDIDGRIKEYFYIAIEEIKALRKSLKEYQPKDDNSFEVGDSFACIKDYTMKNGDIAFTKGNLYYVEDFDENEVLLESDDQEHPHWMTRNLLNVTFKKVVEL